MNELTIFNNPSFGEIRVTEINNEPWFCLADVCNPLGLRAARCRERLKPEGVRTRDTPTSSGIQSMLWVNEGNLYRTIFQSKKPEAEQFTDWVTEDVLPSLRKAGTYMVTNVAPTVSPSGLARLISVTRTAMLDMGCSSLDVGQMVQTVYRAWNVPLPNCFPRQLPGQLSIWGKAME